MKTRVFLGMVACVVLALTGCPPAKTGTADHRPGGDGQRHGGPVNPDACGQINTSKVGKKLYAFLVASAELERTTTELENTIRDACKAMATELGVSPAGTTKEVCDRATQELQANLQISVKTEKRLVTRTVPPVCHTDVSLTANFAAECEASAAADISVTCQGQCGGTCNGQCDGTCAGGGGGGQCAGQCQGTCRGKCSGECNGYADVNASAECKATAEVRAQTHTTCTPARVEVVQQDVTIVDATKFDHALKAINVGLPPILTAGKRLELAGKALGLWVVTGGKLIAASGQLVHDIGDRGLCVAAQLASVVAATADIQARFQVSVEVTASVSASAGASAQ